MRKMAAAGLAALFMLSSVSVQAGPYVVQGPFVTPVPGAGIPGPRNVPGKEYSNLSDRNAYPDHALSPLQVIRWDGAGGTANGYNYGGTMPLPGPEVDALANTRDALFQSVINNSSALLFSVEGDTDSLGNAHQVPVYSESISGVGQVWATPLEVDQAYVPGNTDYDLDGLEVWGSELQSDSDRFSLAGDVGGVSVWNYDPNTNTSTAFVTTLQIATAIGRPDLAVGIDLDALMSWDDQLLFSIRPIDVFDGGEIWYWDGINPATFLVHGGHVWDTAFNVTALYGSENVDALEAVSVPEPSTLALVVVGLLGVTGWRRRTPRA